MLSYEDRLAAFAGAMADGTDAPLGIRAASAARIALYRNNVRVNRIAALLEAFANVVQMVGLDYFRALARAYVDAVPAASANLNEDGARLPAFIRTFAPARALPYLADVARVDWLMHLAYFADDAPAVDPAVVSAIGPERFGMAVLRFAPSLGLARSARWPIADIVAMHEGGPSANVGTGGQALMVWRERYVVHWAPLDAAQARALDALLAGATVSDALTATPAADPTTLLTQLFGQGLVCAIEESS
jgi:hypothetical protein